MGQRFEFDIVYTPKDYQEFIVFTLKRRKLPGLLLLLFVTGVFGLLGAHLLIWGDPEDHRSYIQGVMQALMFIGLFLIFSNWIQSRFTKPARNGMFLRPCHLTVDDSRIIDTTVVSETSLSWDAVTGCHLEKKHIFLALDNNHAIIIPRHLFTNRDHETVFVELANSRIGKEGRLSAPVTDATKDL